MKSKVTLIVSLFTMSTLLGEFMKPGDGVISSFRPLTNSKISFNLSTSTFSTPLYDEPKPLIEYVKFNNITYNNKQEHLIMKWHICYETDEEKSYSYNKCVLSEDDYNEFEYTSEHNFTFDSFVEIDTALPQPIVENPTYRLVRVNAGFGLAHPADGIIKTRYQHLEFVIEYYKGGSYEEEGPFKYKSKEPIRMVVNDSIYEEYFENYNFESLLKYQSQIPFINLNDLYVNYFFKNRRTLMPYVEEAYLLVDEVYSKSDIEKENGMAKFPLDFVFHPQGFSFALKNSLYYDSTDGMVYASNKNGRRAINNLLLPASFNPKDKEVYYEFHFKTLGVDQIDVVIKSYAKFADKWFGDCQDSYYCIDKVLDLLENVNYEGGSEV